MSILSKTRNFGAVICGVVVAILVGAACAFTPVSAVPCTCRDAQGNTLQGTAPDTSILDPQTACDCGHGEAIMGILKLVVDIMTIGVGILGVLGITIVGIQYLTAGGNEERVRKAKRRMLEIVIGIAVYVVVYAALKFLIPDFQGL